MDKLEWMVCICAVCLAMGLICHRNYKERRLLRRLDRMLNEAMTGSFEEREYDETLLAAVEAKMARFLGSSKLSYRQVERERDKIRTLISDISHQTKTPIANIRLFSEILLETKLPDQARCAAKALNGQVEKLQFLVDVLVKMSRMENGIITVKPAKQSVEELIEGVCNEILPKAKEKGIKIIRNMMDIDAIFDMKWTAEALYNLLDNGVKYTNFGDSIKISAKAYEMFCRIDITDHGIGISETEQAQIFTRFYRSPDVSQTEGIGVGLYLAREIIVSQGGYIRVRSEKGEGAVFSVFLPLKN